MTQSCPVGLRDPPHGQAPRLARAKSHACTSSLQNIRLSSDVPNPLSRSRNWQADGDGCVAVEASIP